MTNHFAFTFSRHSSSLIAKLSGFTPNVALMYEEFVYPERLVRKHFEKIVFVDDVTSSACGIRTGYIVHDGGKRIHFHLIMGPAFIIPRWLNRASDRTVSLRKHAGAKRNKPEYNWSKKRKRRLRTGI